MANRFLYIDDNPPSLNEAIIRALNATGKIEAIPIEALEWSAQIDLICSKVTEYDGLLIDWRLGNIIGYDAEALAQHVRNLVAVGKLEKDIPVVLCSANSKFREDFGRDNTSHDLFLATYSKDEVANQAGNGRRE